MAEFDHHHHEPTTQQNNRRQPHQQGHQQQFNQEFRDTNQFVGPHKSNIGPIGHIINKDAVLSPETESMTNQDQSNQRQNNDGPTRQRPSIVDRVNQIPIVSMAVNVTHDQYDKLKQSNVTVGGVMSKAEQLAFYMWGSVQPIVTKFQEPLGKADKLACQTLDYVEQKVPSIKKSPAELLNDGRSMRNKYTQVVEQSTIARLFKMIAESFYKTLHQTSSQVTPQAAN